MKTILYIAPHLSTGGLPQYLTKKIEELKNNYNIYVIEYEDVTGGVLVVQKNKIRDLIGDNLLTIPWGGDKQFVIETIERIKPDIVHLEEMPEYFMSDDIANQIYTNNRTYKIFETSHDSSFDINTKRFRPDKFILVSNFQVKMLSGLNIDSSVVEYPIEYKERPNREDVLKELGLDPEYKHVLHVGLFTPRKNQAEFFEYAKSLENEKIMFHSVGNTADNFRYYWEPLLADKPNNLIVHGERSDVDKFYSAMDLFLFTSRGTVNDKETMPLVIREAISWKIPILIYNLPVYENYFDKYNEVSYLSFDDFECNKGLILNKLNVDESISTDTLVIISTYPNSEHIIDLTKKSIDAIKKQGYKVMLSSHYPINEELQNLSDYIVVDKNNLLTYHDYFSTAWQTSDEMEMMMNIKTEKNHQYHGPAVYTNYYNGISLAKSLGYGNVVCFNYDMIIEDPNVIQFYVNELKTNKAVYNSYNAMEGPCLRTVIFATNTTFFLDNFKLIKTADEYNDWQKTVGSESNGLENIFHHNLKNQIQKIKTLTNDEYTNLLKNCKTDLCSMVEYFNVLPVKERPDLFAVWLSTSNLEDNRDMIIDVMKNGKLFDHLPLKITTSSYRYTAFIFEPGDVYNILLFENGKIKKEIIVDDEYFNNKLKINGLLTIK
jgi:glycosyltransferase involved in cell wall biosynthesis